MLRKEKKTETTTRDVVVEHRCDLCGCDLNEEAGEYETKEATVSVRDGTSYPGEGWGTTSIVDVCVKCMMDKVFPWFKSNGVTVRVEEYDY